MRIGKPEAGYRNMRKVTANEAKLLGLDKKMMVKIMIMTDDDGHVTFWLPQRRSNDVTRFTGTDDQYFDDKVAIVRLEEYWAKFSAKAS